MELKPQVFVTPEGARGILLAVGLVLRSAEEKFTAEEYDQLLDDLKALLKEHS